MSDYGRRVGTRAKRGRSDYPDGPLSQQEQVAFEALLPALSDIAIKSAAAAFGAAIGGSMFAFCRFLIDQGMGIMSDEPDDDGDLDEPSEELYFNVMELKEGLSHSASGGASNAEQMDILRESLGAGSAPRPMSHGARRAPRQRTGYRDRRPQRADDYDDYEDYDEAPRRSRGGSRGGRSDYRNTRFQELSVEQKVDVLVQANANKDRTIRGWMIVTIMMTCLNLVGNFWGQAIYDNVTTHSYEWLCSFGEERQFERRHDLVRLEEDVEEAEATMVDAEEVLVANQDDPDELRKARSDYRRASRKLDRADDQLESVERADEKARERYAPQNDSP